MTAVRGYRMLIYGAWVASSDGKFDSVNPTTGQAAGQAWARVPEATADDVDRAVQAADRAFTSGHGPVVTPTARGRRLRRPGDLLAEQSKNPGRTETIDTGKMLKETRRQASYFAKFFHVHAGCADKICAPGRGRF